MEQNLSELPIEAPTPAKPVSQYAGSKLAKIIDYGAKGVTIAGAGFDLVSLFDNNKKGREKAQQIAKQFVNAGITNYDDAMAIAQGSFILESAVGDIGASDYAKTVAGIGMQAGDIVGAGPLALATVPLGVVRQINDQRKKAGRNEAFREQFAQELINRGISK